MIRRKLLHIVAVLLLSFVISASHFSRAGGDSSKTTVAIMDFNVQCDFKAYADSSSVAMSVSEYLYPHVSSKCQLVERQYIEAIIDEWGISGFLGADSSDRLKLGRLLAADCLITGDFIYSDGRWRFVGKLIHVKTADVIKTVSVDLVEKQDVLSVKQSELRQIVEGVKAVFDNLDVHVKKIPRVAPLFFHNVSETGDRLDRYESQWPDWLRKGLGIDVRVTDFHGAETASREVGLGLSGLAEANPNSVDELADVYVWGHYKEVEWEGKSGEDAKVSAVLHVWDGMGSPRAFEFVLNASEFESDFIAFVRDSIKSTIKMRSGGVPQPSREKAAEIMLKEIRSKSQDVIMRFYQITSGRFVNLDHLLKRRLQYIQLSATCRFVDPKNHEAWFELLAEKWRPDRALLWQQGCGPALAHHRRTNDWKLFFDSSRYSYHTGRYRPFLKKKGVFNDVRLNCENAVLEMIKVLSERYVHTVAKKFPPGWLEDDIASRKKNAASELMISVRELVKCYPDQIKGHENKLLEMICVGLKDPHVLELIKKMMPGAIRILEAQGQPNRIVAFKEMCRIEFESLKRTQEWTALIKGEKKPAELPFRAIPDLLRAYSMLPISGRTPDFYDAATAEELIAMKSSLDELIVEACEHFSSVAPERFKKNGLEIIRLVSSGYRGGRSSKGRVLKPIASNELRCRLYTAVLNAVGEDGVRSYSGNAFHIVELVIAAFGEVGRIEEGKHLVESCGLEDAVERFVARSRRWFVQNPLRRQPCSSLLKELPLPIKTFDESVSIGTWRTAIGTPVAEICNKPVSTKSHAFAFGRRHVWEITDKGIRRTSLSSGEVKEFNSGDLPGSDLKGIAVDEKGDVYFYGSADGDLPVVFKPSKKNGWESISVHAFDGERTRPGAIIKLSVGAGRFLAAQHGQISVGQLVDGSMKWSSLHHTLLLGKQHKLDNDVVNDVNISKHGFCIATGSGLYFTDFELSSCRKLFGEGAEIDQHSFGFITRVAVSDNLLMAITSEKKLLWRKIGSKTWSGYCEVDIAFNSSSTYSGGVHLFEVYKRRLLIGPAPTVVRACCEVKQIAKAK